jgi:adenylate cyclase
MTQTGLDPAPRSYARAVTLQRRGDGGPSAAPADTTLEETAAWLLADAIAENDLLALFESLAWRLVAAGMPLDRASLHVGTLHPQMIGFAWNWARADGFCDEVRVEEASLKTDAYRKNPLYRVIEFGETVRAKTSDRDAAARFPLVAELADRGITEYVALPLTSGGAYHNAATVATRQPGGFAPEQFAELNRILKLLALHVERHILLRIAANVLDTYLGTAAGGRVLSGEIRRGAGEPIRATVWASDLRGFTDLSDRLSGSEMIVLLNAYFERLAGAVVENGGEVLKFIGDGLLAVFPFDAFADETAATEASLAAAEQGLAAVDHLNAEPPAEMRAIDGWQPLRTGIALHEGEVFFGNVGAPERLDFTVIGRAVNTASRVEALTKSLHRPILMTVAVATRLDRPLDDLGEHALRGVTAPVRIFAPRS